MNKNLNFISWSSLFKSYFKEVARGSDSVMFLSQGVEVIFPNGTKIIGSMESNTPSYKDTYVFTHTKNEPSHEMTPKELVENVLNKVRIRIDELPKNTKFRLLD